MTVLEKVKTVEVFDPAMCCSTGVCGPSVDPELAQFAGDIEWLEHQGVTVQRYNLAQQPGEFAERKEVATALGDKGEACLPMVFVDGRLVSEGTYSSREELSRMAGVEQPEPGESFWNPAVKELVAIAASVASNCEGCLEHHVGVAHELGVDDATIARTVKMAKVVKETPARKILGTADRLLGSSAEVSTEGLPVVECSGSESDSGSSSGGCC